MNLKNTTIIASILSIMLISGCGAQEQVKDTNNTTGKATATTSAAANTTTDKATAKNTGETTSKIDTKQKIWTLNEIRDSKDFVAVAKDEVGTSYVYKPSIEVKSVNGKQNITATVWRDYTVDKHLIKEEQKYEYDSSTKDMELASTDKVYSYDGKFIENGDERKMMPVDKDAYGYIMGQNILKVKNGETVTLK